ncbi:hypothetical protein DUNSADRAFT_9173 [Dunaliella salina]|uniref:SET domain-containing protein n=1 Tax=Dunaliella salina TaxID=3046 RepID=A0ABQ7GI29_DUNSA|nr:hypothetical protein DUNSADRAFT_9173 [Dunaliella salina]|eukprot:KAF5834261.1 hypothetical protein DUNSADRAFT_9173 [Dunaliella salina]
MKAHLGCIRRKPASQALPRPSLRLHRASATLHQRNIRDDGISKAQWDLWDKLMTEDGFSASVVPAQSPFGQGLAWDRPADDDSVVATVPFQYILSDQLSPSFCPGIPESAALQAIYADEENSWEIKIGAALLWAVNQGPTLLNGFWASYADEFMPDLKDLTSTLTMNLSELRLLEDTKLMHKSLAWQSAVRKAYNKFIACPAFVAECGEMPTYEQFLWATACAESRAYSTQVDGAEVSVVVPIFDLANHRHGAVVGARLQPSFVGSSIELHTHDVFSCSSNSSGGELALGRQRGGGPPVPEARVHFFSNYGDKGNRDLVDQYGFTVPGNPLERIPLDKQFGGTISYKNSTEDPANSFPSQPGTPPLTMRRDLVFKTAERLLGLDPASNGSSTATRVTNTAVAAVSAALHNPAFVGDALQHLNTAICKKEEGSLGGDNSSSSSSSSSGGGSSKAFAEDSAGKRSWYWWWRANEGVLEELLDSAIVCVQPAVSAECLERVRGVLGPYFELGPVRARMQAAAYSVVEAYGWRNLPAYNSITRDGERLCVHQAEEHVQQSLLLGFSSPTPQKEVLALINLERSGDAASSKVSVVEGGGLAANSRAVAALLNRMERKLLAATALALLASLKKALDC